MKSLLREIQPTKVEQQSRLEKVQIIYWITKQVRKSANHSLNNEANYIEKVHLILIIQPTKVERQSMLEKLQVILKIQPRKIEQQSRFEKVQIIH